MDPANIPIACQLSPPELRQREATLLAEFKSAVLSVEDLPDGFRFHLPGREQSLTLLAHLIAAERQCCPFLHFAIDAAPNLGPLSLTITGPAGTKDFLRPLFL